MHVCCNEMPFLKSEYHCCKDGAVKRTDGPERCCQEENGEQRYNPTLGEKCCKSLSAAKVIKGGDEHMIKKKIHLD